MAATSASGVVFFLVEGFAGDEAFLATTPSKILNILFYNYVCTY